MSSTAALPRHAGTLVLALGALTMLCALSSGAFFETYQGAGIIGHRAAGAAALSAVLLVATVVALISMARVRPLDRRGVVGLILAVSAFPATFVLMAATVSTLNAFGVYW